MSFSFHHAVDEIHRLRWRRSLLEHDIRRRFDGHGLTRGEARVLWALGHGEATATWLGYRLGMDEGYLCRILARTPRAHDYRIFTVALTDTGAARFVQRRRECDDRVLAWLSRMGPARSRALLRALRTADRLFLTGLAS